MLSDTGEPTCSDRPTLSAVDIDELRSQIYVDYLTWVFISF